MASQKAPVLGRVLALKEGNGEGPGARLEVGLGGAPEGVRATHTDAT